jgi:DUF971 family protein
MRDTPDPSFLTADLPDSAATHLQKIIPMGAYAILLVWEDGHDSGIYRWEYLRDLCPCAEHLGRW